MQIIRSLNFLPDFKAEIALAIGNFDGVHCGHGAIIDQLKQQAKAKKLPTAILTFEPHPACFFSSGKLQNFRITSLAQKLRIFAGLGIDYVFIIPFTQDFAKVLAEDFVDKILIKGIGVKYLVVGYDFTFGRNKEGDFAFLSQKSAKGDFTLKRVEAVSEDNKIYSSSAIRGLITEGNIKDANQMLGRNFVISGIVNSGKKLASQLGFPTMNLAAKPQIVRPKFGVYKTVTFIPHLNQKLPSITNFGVKPTIDQNLAPIYENHVLNFNTNLYDKKIFIEFLDFVREERKFSSIEELKKQIQSDIDKIT